MSAVASVVLVSLLSYPFAGCATEPVDLAPPALRAPADTLQSTPSAPQEGSSEQSQAQATGDVDDAALRPDTGPDVSAAKPTDWLHGSLAVRYRGRSGGDDEEHTVGGYLTLDASNPDKPTTRAHVEARVDVDLDGSDDDEVFGDLSDTYDSAAVPKLYLAYGELGFGPDPATSPGAVRIGRQSDSRLPEFVRLDGVSIAATPDRESELELGAYGGVPVHLYESPTDSGLAYGLFAERLVWKDGRARFDWMHLEDDLVLGDHRDDLLALSLWQTIDEHVRCEGAYSHLESNPRDLSLRGFYDDVDSQTSVRVAYYQLLETQTANANELDPFFEQLFDYFPYRQATLNVSRGLGEHSTIDVGFDMRRVIDSGDIGEYNRDWERYYATFTQVDVFEPGIAFSVTGDLWDDDDRDISSVGADVSYTPDERWTTAIGTYYSLYKYSFLEFDERDDVRTYFARASYELSESVELDALYEYEDDDFETYHTVRLGALWRF